MAEVVAARGWWWAAYSRVTGDAHHLGVGDGVVCSSTDDADRLNARRLTSGASMQPQPPIAFPFAEFLYRPRTTWTRFFNPQFFVTHNHGDAAIENHILSRAGSYGKQLGTVLDVLDVVVRHLPVAALAADERRTLDEFITLREKVEDAKHEFRGGEDNGAPVDVDRVLADLARLRRTDPDGYAAAVERLRAGLAGNGDAS